MDEQSTPAEVPLVGHTVEPVVVRLSDSVTIIRGDCLACLPIEADAVVSDPPYGIDWDTDYRRFTTGFDVPRTNHTPVANDAKSFDPTPWLGFKTVVLFGATCYAKHLPLGSWLVWDKRFANGKAFLADGEAAWMNRGHGLYIYSETAQGFVRKEPIQHPTQKPVGVMAWCMDKARVPEGATVLDPYMGSGTTGVACIRTGRKFIGIEIDAGHFETARKRMEAELMQGTFDFSGGAVAPTQNASLDRPAASAGTVGGVVGLLPVGLIPIPPMILQEANRRAMENGDLTFGHGFALVLALCATWGLCAVAIWIKRAIVRRFHKANTRITDSGKD